MDTFFENCLIANSRFSAVFQIGLQRYYFFLKIIVVWSVLQKCAEAHFCKGVASGEDAHGQVVVSDLLDGGKKGCRAQVVDFFLALHG